MHTLQSVVVSPFHSTPIEKTPITPQHIVQAYTSTTPINSLSEIQFPGKEITSISLQLPPFPNCIGISILDDDHFCVPYITRILPNTVAHDHFPPGKRRNYFIIGINAESPITSGYALEILQKIQQSPSRMATIDLIHRGHADTTTGIAEIRATFDALPSILGNRPLIASAYDTPTQPDHFISCSGKPVTPKSYFAAMKTNYKHNWKAAAFIQFLKNHNLAVFSIPFPYHDLPPG